MIKDTPFLHKLVSGVRNEAYKQRSLVPLSLAVSFEAILDALSFPPSFARTEVVLFFSQLIIFR